MRAAVAGFHADFIRTAPFIRIKRAVFRFAVNIQRRIGKGTANCILRTVRRVQKRGTAGLLAAPGLTAADLNFRSAA